MTTAVTPAQRISDFQKFVNQHEDDIREAGNAAWSGIKGSSEVERVHDFLSSPTAGNSLLNKELTPLFHDSGWVVKVAGIFLHQTPYVKGFLPDDKTPLPQRCELGDLQTLFVHVSEDKTAMRTRSVIFQAKMKRSLGSHVVSHAIQRQLYDDSPSFQYESPIAKGKRRLPTGLDRERALQYLFVDESPVTARTIPSLKGLGGFVEYGEHLLRFLNDSTGLNVDTSKNADDWSTIVNDMISAFNQSMPNGNYTRQQGLKDILDPFNSFEDHKVTFLEGKGRGGNEDGGFGLQLVIVWDAELGKDAGTGIVAPLDHLRRLADYYDTSHYKEYALRIHRKNELVEQMSQLIRSQKIELKDVLIEALESKSQGMAAALGQVLCEIPNPDWADIMIQLLPGMNWLHAVKLVLSAILVCAPKGLKLEAAKRVEEGVQHKLKEDNRVQELLRRIEKLAKDRYSSEFKNGGGASGLEMM
jgi:hypothetical protein